MKKSAFFIAFAYLVSGTIWILVSDRIILLFVDTPADVSMVQTYKGWFFIGVTGMLLFIVLHNYMKKLEHSRELVREQSRQFENMVSNLPGMLYQCRNDEFWTMNFVSEGSEKLTGYRADQFVSGEMNFIDIIHPDDQDQVYKVVQRHVKEQTPFVLNYRIITSKKRSIWVLERGIGVYNQKGGIIALEGFISSIDELIQTRIKLKDSLDKLEVINKELQLLFYRSSHDLKGPVASILGLISLAERENNPGEYMPLIKRTAGKLNALINKLAGVPDIRSSEIKTTKLDAGKFMDEILKGQNEDTGTDTDIKVEVESCEFFCDKKLLKIAVENVFLNAVKYRNYRAKKHVVSLKLFREAQQVHIEISDNGNGIAVEIQPYVFDMFYRGSEQSDGAGLGLYIARKAMDRLNGEINLKSMEEDGTSVRLSLPQS